MKHRTPRKQNAKAAKVAKPFLISFLCVLCALRVQDVRAAVPPVRTMYNDALAREQTVRTALAADEASPAALEQTRAAIARYEALVKHYPASGYSDNALWQAARLALDAFAKFGQPPDKDAGIRLLRRLAASYPSSKLAVQAAGELEKLGHEAPKADDRPPAPAEKSSLATIKTIRRTVLPDAVRVVIELDAEVGFHEERIPDPSRVFVDLPGTRAGAGIVDRTIRYESDADVVRQIRIGRHPNNVTRVVLDAHGVSSYSVYPLYEPFRLVIDCVRTMPTRPVATTIPEVRVRDVPVVLPPEPPALAARSTAVAWLRSAPTNNPQHSLLLADARMPEPEVVPVSLTPTAVKALEQMVTKHEPPAVSKVEPLTAPPRNSSGGFSISRQLGLGVSRIVIDPGHGGHDPGAQGRGVVEAELVLDVALRVEKLLQKTPGVEVILTRRTDDFVALQERTAIANREGADLFLSIHANASSSVQAHGIETYFLNFASNLSAAAVAARENAASGQNMAALPDIVKSIALNNKLDESRDFAAAIQRAMVERLRPANKLLRDLGVKQAPFVVLIGAAMPSVLAEISFVTNPQEARLLKNNAYRQRIADALFNAIRKYQGSLKAVTTAAPLP